MIDTIVLMLKPDQFSITDHDKFSPSTKGLFGPSYYPLGKRANFSCFQNPTTDDFKKGIYKPRLTATRRRTAGAFITVLKIEFSIPKLLYGNNFDEVDKTDFEEVIKRLTTRLNEMGVVVFPEILRAAPVSGVHYSKNIVLTDYSTPSMILAELAKIDITRQLDLNKTDYRNEGHSLKFRANSYEVSLYDKKKDLQKAKTSEKRAIEQDNALQFELFDQWKPKVPFEVLRMEIRLNKRAKIRQVFDKLEIASDLSFRSIFKSEISQKVLLYYLAEIKKGYGLLAYRPKSMKDFIAEFKINNPKVKIRKMLQVYAVQIGIAEMGVREFREATATYGRHNWDRLKKDLATHRFSAGDFSILKPIETALRDFRAVKLVEFQEKSFDVKGTVQ